LTTKRYEYIYGKGRKLAKIEYEGDVLEAQVYYYHNDLLGSPVCVTDIDGSVVWKGDYLPFGEPLQEIDTVYWGNAYTYLGNEDDGGLMYFNARYYAKELGRFMSCDPIKDMASSALTINPYVYCGNNPIVFKDPLGLRQAPGPSWGDDEPGGVSPGFGHGGFDTWGGQSSGDASGTSWDYTFFYSTLWMDIARQSGSAAVADILAPIMYRIIDDMNPIYDGAGEAFVLAGNRINIEDLGGNIGGETAAGTDYITLNSYLFVSENMNITNENLNAVRAGMAGIVAHEIFHRLFWHSGLNALFEELGAYIAGYNLAELYGGLEPAKLTEAGFGDLAAFYEHEGRTGMSQMGLYNLYLEGDWFGLAIGIVDVQQGCMPGPIYASKYRIGFWQGGIPGAIYRFHTGWPATYPGLIVPFE
jgi:RHS repeat-associated protein